MLTDAVPYVPYFLLTPQKKVAKKSACFAKAWLHAVVWKIQQHLPPAGSSEPLLLRKRTRTGPRGLALQTNLSFGSGLKVRRPGVPASPRTLSISHVSIKTGPYKQVAEHKPKHTCHRHQNFCHRPQVPLVWMPECLGVTPNLFDPNPGNSGVDPKGTCPPYQKFWGVPQVHLPPVPELQGCTPRAFAPAPKTFGVYGKPTCPLGHKKSPN